MKSLTRRYGLRKRIQHEQLHWYQQRSNTHLQPFDLCLGGVGLGHGVQSATVLEPLDLRSVVSVGKLDLEGLAILGVDPHGEGLANLELGAQKINLGLTVSNLYISMASDYN